MLCCLSSVGAAADPARPRNGEPGTQRAARSGAAQGGAFQWRFRVQKSQIRIPHVQHSLLLGRRQTSHVTTSCVSGSQCTPEARSSSSSMPSPPSACAHTELSGARAPQRSPAQAQAAGRGPVSELCPTKLSAPALIGGVTARALAAHCRWTGTRQICCVHNRACNATGRRQEEVQPERTLPATPST